MSIISFHLAWVLMKPVANGVHFIVLDARFAEHPEQHSPSAALGDTRASSLSPLIFAPYFS